MHAFVIGPIGDQLAEPGSPERTIYEEAIEILEEVIIEAWVAAGHERSDISRSDTSERPGELTEQIVREVLDADLVIADLTGANANVMYELGLRHASGRPTVQIGEKERLPFDVNVIRTIQFKRSPNILTKCRKRLTSAISLALSGEYDQPTAGRLFRDTARQAHVEAAATSDAADDVDVIDEDGEEIGYLELIADMEDAIPDLNDRLEALSTITEEVGALSEEQGEKATHADTSRQKVGIMNVWAERLDPLARDYDRLSVELAAKVRTIDLGIGELIRQLREDPSQIPEGREGLKSIVTLAETTLTVIPQSEGFRNTAAGLEGVTSRARPRIRMLVAGVDRVIAAFKTVSTWGPPAAELLAQAPEDD